MSRYIKDIKNTDTGELIYPRTHAKAVVYSSEKTLEDVLENATFTLTFTDVEASTWVEDSTYEDFTYRCDLSCSGVLETDYAEVVFNVLEATSGVYAPVCRTSTDIVSIWASENTTITVPTIIITR